MTEVETSPGSRLNYSIQVADFVRDNVMAADPNEGRCLITNNPSPTQLCHCVSRVAMNDDHMLDCLEWAWDMSRHRLNLDTRYNLFYADNSIHFLFDHLGWLLLPETHIIETYYNSLTPVSGIRLTQRGSFPVIENGVFDYRFVPLQGLDKNAITRIDSFPTEDNLVSPTQCTVHRYPFNTLPNIKSHLHPKFAIVNAGGKMQQLFKTNGIIFRRALLNFPSLRLVMEVYSAWTGWPDVNDPSFNVPLDIVGEDSNEDGDDNNNTDSDYDDRTVPWRVSRSTKNAPQGSSTHKRKRANPLPQVSGSKRKVLSELSLSKHNQQSGACLWSDNRIREWCLPSYEVTKDKKNCWLGCS